jgi:two-component system CheB/CheR fusion protein
MSDQDHFPIVGIGASAGGIEALEGFFRGLPRDARAALVIVTHLSPDRESVLHEIIARYTDLPVEIASDGQEICSDRVYVMPSNHILTVEKRHLVLRKNTSRREPKPIDIFFSSLAVDTGELAVGVILSGGDSDGTLGVKAIKEYGGLTLAQVADGFGPQHPDMPDSAISSGLIDFAVPVEKMGEKLANYARSLALLDGISVLGEDFSIGKQFDEQLSEIYAIIRNQIGHDFSGYKPKTFLRRVQRRMQVTQIKSIEGYVELLRQQPQEVGALFRDLLINVTNFFRDKEAFQSLAEMVIPKLFEGRGADETVRIWVPGCATGEEVFSIGILIREHIDRLTAVPRVQIFATDIDERALSVARAARYPAPLLDDVSAERRSRFFIADGGSYLVSKDVRELCIFSPHSVIRDPPFSRIDLVSCRNLLIYFGGEVQNQVIPVFHYALKPDGCLFLGSAENVSQFGDLFAPLDKHHRIFRRRSDVSPNVRLPIMLNALRPGHAAELVPRRAPLGGLALRQAVDHQVIERFAPPHVVVNQDGDIVYYSTRTGKYLEAPGGSPTRQLLASARKSLKLDLRTLFREAVESGRSSSRDGIAVEHEDGRVQTLDLTIEPLTDGASSEPLFIVLFSDQGPTLSREEALIRARERGDGSAIHSERELRETRDRLQSMIEEYETALEELKSSNEELVSVNEEMQSTNEELEASKEELQSVNEELHTVNGELNAKIDELDRSNNDLLNLFESTAVATVFLDKSLVIRSFTPAVAHVFNILPTDRGRPITDLSSRLDLSGFADDIAKVFADHRLIERRAQNIDGTEHYLVRLGPYRNGDHKTEGVVVTFVNVSSLTRSESRQRVLIAELQHRTRNLLTVVQSIGQQTLGKGGTYADFTARLAALSRVQGLIGDTTQDTIDLGDLVRLELQAIGAADDKATISGPSVPLSLDLVQTMGLALHELATNAVKHGALREPKGRLSISWDIRQDNSRDRRVALHWRESGVTVERKPTRLGFGRQLLEKALSFELRAKTQLTFEKDGVSCRIEIPISSPEEARANAGPEVVPP